jgi:hypothetical protein
MRRRAGQGAYGQLEETTGVTPPSFAEEGRKWQDRSLE